MYNRLPDLDKAALSTPWFPTRMQAFIFRNWHSVNKFSLAKVLKTSVDNVSLEAKRMGLGEQGKTDVWAERGYITIIRNNWHLLDYEQLLELLGWNEERLAHVLKEDDFLEIKLGKKPICKKITYTPLTNEQIELTELNFKSIKELTSGYTATPFEFWKDEPKPKIKKPKAGQIIIDSTWGVVDKTNNTIVEKTVNRFKTHINYMWNITLNGKENFIEINLIQNEKEEYHEIIIKKNKITINGASSAGILRALYRLEDISKINGGMHFDISEYKRVPRFDTRFIYSFSALYEAALDVNSEYWCPDELLEKYAGVGVNGIWLQAVLYRVTPFPFDKNYSLGWETRIKNLKKFCDRAEEYGIKIYLYLNEPRCMPLDFFEKHPNLKGGTSGKYACMCMSNPDVQNYLFSAVQQLCKEVPQLGGFFTISMSENPTHCKSRPEITKCPHCKDKSVGELVNLVNKTIAKAAYSINPKIKLFAWNWGWDKEHGMDPKELRIALSEMPCNVIAMATREDRIKFNRGGVDNAVIDYSISVKGVSEMSQELWYTAKSQGLDTAVKLQLNNTWECSTTPYIPVYKTLINHINKMINTGISHLMLSWTLGGYPSPSIKFISESFFIENENTKPNYDNTLKVIYGDKYSKVKEASDVFSDAFSEFPNNLDVLYNGPQNGGVANLFYSKPTAYSATMTCFAYDALDDWRGNYSREVLRQQYKRVAEEWKAGLDLLDETDGEIYDIGYICYSLFKSSYNQVEFVMLRDDSSNEKLVAILQDELEIAKNVYRIMCRRSEVGFEAANHYYLNTDNILEKIVNCEYLVNYYQN